jgi:hypothetical protein
MTHGNNSIGSVSLESLSDILNKFFIRLFSQSPYQIHNRTLLVLRFPCLRCKVMRIFVSFLGSRADLNLLFGDHCLVLLDLFSACFRMRVVGGQLAQGTVFDLHERGEEDQRRPLYILLERLTHSLRLILDLQICSRLQTVVLQVNNPELTFIAHL